MITDNPQKIAPILDSLRKSFGSHKTLSLEFRATQLRNLLKGVQTLAKQFNKAHVEDLGGSEFNSELYSVQPTILDLKHTLSQFKKWSKPRPKDTIVVIGPAKSYLLPEPFGVALVLSAWNAPVFTAIPPVASAIAAGNCIMLKPSEMSPNTSNLLKKLFDEYLDKDCYQCVEGAVEVAKTVIQQHFDLIVFTGSTLKGKLVAKAAAEYLTPCILELGGKSPTIIDQGANLENAALRIIQGRFMNSGQICVSPDYVFIHKSIVETMIKLFKQKITQFYGENQKESVDYSRMINEFHTQRVSDLLKNTGGEIAFGGAVDLKQKYIQPTIVRNPSPSSALMQEEIFGPILPVLEFEDVNEVINFINSKPKPLALYYFGPFGSNNRQLIESRTSSGAFAVNEACFHLISQDLPFGGVGLSGTGACHGQLGYDNCCHLKPVFSKLPINCYPFSARFPPFTNSKQSMLRLLFGQLAFNQSLAVYGIIGLLLAYLLKCSFCCQGK